jgi:hypothetical protein
MMDTFKMFGVLCTVIGRAKVFSSKMAEAPFTVPEAY